MHPVELGRYRIVRPLGRGGMGVVYEAHDPRIDRPVAIKTIALSGLDERETAVFEARFEAEMRFAGRLQHHNIAALYDTGREGDTAYIVMELVPGQDLRRLLAAGRRFEPAEAIGIVGQLLAALDYAHRRQVIHRDVKPANVMLQEDGLVKLCDFGVARPADDEATRTQGVMVGSLHYASPEQIAGLPIDIRTDLFSTGALLFELLTGERPFKGASEAEVLNRIANGETPSCRSLAPQVPPEVDAAIRRALAKRPVDRFASAEEFALALGVPLSATGTGSLPLRPLPPADGTGAAGAARAARPRLPIWIGGGAVAGAALLWAIFARAPADPTNGTTADPQRVAGAASAPALVASGTAPGVAAPAAGASGPAPPMAAAVSGALPQTAAAASGVLSPPDPAEAKPVTVATSASAPPPSTALRPVPPAPPPASASRAPPASASATVPSAPRPPSPARAERLAGPAADPPPPQASAARVATSPPVNRPAQGPWQARLTCGPMLRSAAGRGTEGFSIVFTIEVDWPRLSWQRDSSVATATAAGSFDEAGRFQAQGQVVRKDRVEVLLEQAEGSYSPSSRSIVGRTRLLRPRDNSVVRECQLVAMVGATPPARPAAAQDVAAGGRSSKLPAGSGGDAPPRTAAAATPEGQAPAVPQGDWEGEFSCGASASADQPPAARGAFVSPVSVTVDGSRVRFARDGPLFSESAEGRIDGNNRFTAAGTGRYKQRRGTWSVQVQGEFLREPARLQGRVQLIRSDDGSLARECSLRARPRP